MKFLIKKFLVEFSEESAKLSSLLLQCEEVLKIEEYFQEILKSAILLEDISKTHAISTPHLLVVEKQLLSLSSYRNCTDGILYGLPFILEWNGKVVLYIRFLKTYFLNNIFLENSQL